VKEYPVFIACEGKHIAAIVAIPDETPEAVVLFTTGGGGTLRSQRFRLWTRAARKLADRGIASVRMEFAGVGDSTGDVAMGFRNLPVDDVVRVAEFAMSVTGTSRLGMCGNCGGARASLKAAASLPTCESMVLFWLKPLARTVKGKPFLASAVRMGQRLPKHLNRLAKHLYWRRQERSRRGNDVLEALRSVGRSKDLLLMETRSKLVGDMPRFVADLQAKSSGHRIEMQGIDSTSMQAFQSLADQEVAVTSVVEWFVRSFGSPASAGSVGLEDGAAREGEPAGGRSLESELLG
jgi:alpha/beta superfamily hydrolase